MNNQEHFNGYNKILVPIDGSPNSRKAISYGIGMAQRYGSDLIVLHVLYSQSGFVFHNGTATGTITTSSLDDLNAEAKAEARKWFDEINETAMNKGVKVKTEVVLSVISIVEAILTYSEKENIDLIIVGSKGRSGWKKLILGSVASGISTYAHCPVLIVK